jgi:FkbM family methyltransferase
MKLPMLFAKTLRLMVYRYPTDFFVYLLRDRLRKWFPDKDIITSTKENFKMVVSPHDYISYGIFFFGIYDRQMTNFMKTYIPENGTCFDVGAGWGWFTLLMASLVGPNGRVDSFEAFPPNFRKLETSISLNGFVCVKVNNLAVNNKLGKIYFIPPSDDITQHIKYLNDCSGIGYITPQRVEGSIEVPTISLDQYVESQQIKSLDLIKLDIEGSEYSALVGAKKIIGKFRPIIIVEYNRGTSQRAGTSIRELDQLLDLYGYDRYTFDRGLEKLILENWENRPGNDVVFNVYCFPR